MPACHRHKPRRHFEALTEWKSWKLEQSHGPAGTSHATFIYSALRERLLCARSSAQVVNMISTSRCVELEGEELSDISEGGRSVLKLWSI